MKQEIIVINNPDAKNLIFGQSHFIKTVEDLHEALVNTVPGIKFGLAFCEASGPRLIRTSGTDEAMVALAATNAKTVGCGHTFFIFLENAFPINVLNAVKMVPEVVRIFAATANPLEVIVARTKQGGGVLGVVDGGQPAGIEKSADVAYRKDFLRKIGYKL
ncbi:MAG: adenosine-specific kinase [Candidatus Gottesmanbacteria bacterium]|nr:adenosine-specific kinase [Candidatus Gottesmanbacteria bacterium]